MTKSARTFSSSVAKHMTHVTDVMSGTMNAKSGTFPKLLAWIVTQSRVSPMNALTVVQNLATPFVVFAKYGRMQLRFFIVLAVEFAVSAVEKTTAIVINAMVVFLPPHRILV